MLVSPGRVGRIGSPSRSAGLVPALDATAEQIRSAIRDISRYGVNVLEAPTLLTVNGVGPENFGATITAVSDNQSFRFTYDLSTLVSGATYRVEFDILTLPSNQVVVDWCDQPAINGTQSSYPAVGHVLYEGARAYDSTYRFLDILIQKTGTVITFPTIRRLSAPGFLLPGTAGARINASARSSVALERQDDGTYLYAPHNLIPDSSLNTVSGYSLSNCSDGGVVAVAKPTGAAPSDSVRSVVYTAAGAWRFGDLGGPAGTRLTGGIWMRAASGSVDVTLDVSDGSGVLATLTTAWQFVSGTKQNSSVDSLCFIDVVTGQACTIYFCAPRICRGTDATAYIPTTSAAVFAPAIAYDAAISAWRTQSEPAATNRVKWCRDLSQSDWTKSSCTAAYTATGVDGVANSASTVTASGANATVLQSITHASTERTLSIFLRRRTGTGTVETTINGGTTWVARTLTSEWQRFSTTATLANPNVGIRIVTSGDAVDVDFVQPEDGAVATSPIATYGATATRAEEIDNVPGGAWLSSTAGTFVVDFVPSSVASQGLGVLSLSDGTAPNCIDLRATGRVFIDAGGASQGTPISATPNANVVNKTAVAYAANDFAISTNGATVVTDTSGSVPALSLMRLANVHQAGGPLQGGVTRIRYFNKRLPNAQLQALTQ